MCHSRLTVLSAILAFVNSQGVLDPSTPEVLTDQDQTSVISFVDAQRRAITDAADEQCVTFSESLAMEAQSEADKCSFQASDGSYISYFEPDPSPGTTVTAAKPDIFDVIFAWVNTVLATDPFYTYSSTGGTCDDPSRDSVVLAAQCDVYKQIIYSSASQIGCGISKCSDMDGIGAKGYNFVCKFDMAIPPNTPPYTVGAQCSSCGTLPCSNPGDGTGNICCAASGSTSTPATTTNPSATSDTCVLMEPPQPCGSLYFYCRGGLGAYCDTSIGQCCQGLQTNINSALPNQPTAFGSIATTSCASGTAETNQFGRIRICSPYSYPTPNLCGTGFTCTNSYCCSSSTATGSLSLAEADSIRAVASDDQRFWFGTQFDSNCPPSDRPPSGNYAPCADPAKSGFQYSDFKTLGQRLFNDPNFDASTDLANLSETIIVTFNSKEEPISGCDTVQQSVEKTINIGINDSVQGFEVRDAPKISVSGCDLDNLCTIILYDAGHNFLHNIWTNWPKEQDLNDYRRPGHWTSKWFCPYVFVVFRQTQGDTEIQLTAAQAGSPYGLVLGDLMDDNGLEGPIALTWMNVVGDIYTAQYIRNLKFLDNCAEYMGKALELDGMASVDLNIAINPELSAWIAVDFPSSGLLDPIANGPRTSEQTSEQPNVTAFPRSVPLVAELPSGQYMIMGAHADPSLSGSVYIDWLVYNSANTNLTGGTEQLAYAGPVDCTAANYYYLLFNQPTTLGSILPSLSTTCPTGQENRCQISLDQFIATNNLELMGISRFMNQC